MFSFSTEIDNLTLVERKLRGNFASSEALPSWHSPHMYTSGFTRGNNLRNYLAAQNHRGRGFFHSKCIWECATHTGKVFQTSSLAKGTRFGNVSQGKDMLLAISVKDWLKFGNSCLEAQQFDELFV